MKKLIITLGTLFILSGCELTRVEGKVDDVDVKVSSQGDRGNGKFCPPGQAKKGNC